MGNIKNKLTIAIDGHSSTGKSTVAKSLAKQLGYIYVDTGAMYRAVTLYAIQQNYISEQGLDKEQLVSALDLIDVSFSNINGKMHTFLNDIDVENEIRGLEVAKWVSPVASISKVRKKLVSLQQGMGKYGGVVMDGRDIGTVVFPNAELKIFMTADAAVRAKRRYDELIAKGDTVTFEEVLTNVEERDFIDENRNDSPLKKAEDAILLNNSNLTREAQLTFLLKLVDGLI